MQCQWEAHLNGIKVPPGTRNGTRNCRHSFVGHTSTCNNQLSDIVDLGCDVLFWELCQPVQKCTCAEIQHILIFLEHVDANSGCLTFL